jgi:hypothetical protein
MTTRTEHKPKRRDRSKITALDEPLSVSQKQQENNAIPIWEWITAAIGFVLVACQEIRCRRM